PHDGRRTDCTTTKEGHTCGGGYGGRKVQGGLHYLGERERPSAGKHRRRGQGNKVLPPDALGSPEGNGASICGHNIAGTRS
ncbi:unnamed protein product, partial [Ectocarpus fasciculatus]